MSERLGMFSTLGLILALALGLIAGVLLVVSWFIPPSSLEIFADDVALNLATEILGISLTVGFVDLLLGWRAGRAHRQALAPRAEELVHSIDRLHRIQEVRLKKQSIDDLERYRRALLNTKNATHDLQVLLTGREPDLGSTLTGYRRSVTVQIGDVDDLVEDKENVVSGLSEAEERLCVQGAKLEQLGKRLLVKVSPYYDATGAGPKR